MPHKRSRPFFAHMVGLPDRMDPLPGAQDHRESSSGRHETEEDSMGSVRVSFKGGPGTEPLRRALLTILRRVGHFSRECRRLRPPTTNMTRKFAFCQDAFQDPGRSVMLDGSTQRMLAGKAADSIDTRDLAYRPKPRFRTREPGVKTIIAFNLAFVLWLMYGSL